MHWYTHHLSPVLNLRAVKDYTAFDFFYFRDLLSDAVKCMRLTMLQELIGTIKMNRSVNPFRLNSVLRQFLRWNLR